MTTLSLSFPWRKKTSLLRTFLGMVTIASWRLALHRMEHDYPCVLTPKEKARLCQEQTQLHGYPLEVFQDSINLKEVNRWSR